MSWLSSHCLSNTVQHKPVSVNGYFFFFSLIFEALKPGKIRAFASPNQCAHRYVAPGVAPTVALLLGFFDFTPLFIGHVLPVDAAIEVAVIRPRKTSAVIAV